MSSALPIRLPAGPRRVLAVPRLVQPDDTSCGPTCLHSVYRYYRDTRPLTEIVAGTRKNPDGGTLAVLLGIKALQDGYRANLYPLGLRVMDPTWRELKRSALRDKLVQRASAMPTSVLRDEHLAYVEFLDLGGGVHIHELSPDLILGILEREHPIICGLSATYLYRQMRELPDNLEDDDIAGFSTGHFVVLCGYTGGGLHFHVRDPSVHTPFSRNGRYVVAAQRLTNAILLGDATRDAVMLEIWPRHVGWEPLQEDM